MAVGRRQGWNARCGHWDGCPLPAGTFVRRRLARWPPATPASVARSWPGSRWPTIQRTVTAIRVRVDGCSKHKNTIVCWVCSGLRGSQMWGDCCAEGCTVSFAHTNLSQPTGLYHQDSFHPSEEFSMQIPLSRLHPQQEAVERMRIAEVE